MRGTRRNGQRPVCWPHCWIYHVLNCALLKRGLIGATRLDSARQLFSQLDYLFLSSLRTRTYPHERRGSGLLVAYARAVDNLDHWKSLGMRGKSLGVRLERNRTEMRDGRKMDDDQSYWVASMRPRRHERKRGPTSFTSRMTLYTEKARPRGPGDRYTTFYCYTFRFFELNRGGGLEY